MITISKMFTMATVSILLMLNTATAEIIFSETFENYAPGNHPGLPLQVPDGSDEVWYGARFEHSNGGTTEQGLAVRNPFMANHYARVLDDAGLLFKIPAGYEDITLSFGWRNHLAGSSDRFRIGYYVGNDLGFNESNRIQDFAASHGSPAATLNWLKNNWNPLLNGSGNSFYFKRESYALPDTDMDQEIWVAFWMDSGNHARGHIDNVVVEATSIVPEPSTLMLIGLPALLIQFYRRLFVF